LSRYGLNGKLIAQPGQGDALAAHLLEAARLLEPVDDCDLYVVGRSEDDPDAVWVTEVWRSKEAHAASLTMPEVRELIDRVRPLIAGGADRLETVPVGGKGLGTGG
jgi:quinol monooxygenase YgiN